MQVKSSGSRDTVGAVLEVLGRERGRPVTGGQSLLLEPTSAVKEGAWPNPGWAECQARWSRPAPQALVGP